MSKNIYILPTDKFQNIKLSLFENKLYLGDIASTALPQHIYITSDEEIKEGDYVVQINFEKTNTQVIKCETEFQTKIANSKDGSFSKNKIILTTDTDLIKDGVQEITDEFLEWFVKNPSCESVEVRKECCGQCDERLCEVYDTGIGWNKNNTFYEIILPKEKDYFPDIKIGSILSSEDIVNEITELENQSFEGWTTDSIKGYLLACKNIKEKLM